MENRRIRLPHQITGDQAKEARTYLSNLATELKVPTVDIDPLLERQFNFQVRKGELVLSGRSLRRYRTLRGAHQRVRDLSISLSQTATDFRIAAVNSGATIEANEHLTRVSKDTHVAGIELHKAQRPVKNRITRWDRDGDVFLSPKKGNITELSIYDAEKETSRTIDAEAILHAVNATIPIDSDPTHSIDQRVRPAVALIMGNDEQKVRKAISIIVKIEHLEAKIKARENLNSVATSDNRISVRRRKRIINRMNRMIIKEENQQIKAYRELVEHLTPLNVRRDQRDLAQQVRSRAQGAANALITPIRERQEARRPKKTRTPKPTKLMA